MFLRIDTAGGVILEEADKTEFHESGLWYGLLQSGKSKWYSAFGVLRIAEVDKTEWDRLKSLEAGNKPTEPEDPADINDFDDVSYEEQAEAYRRKILGLGK